jgi:UDP-N-acetylmuramate dehydrogenase
MKIEEHALIKNSLGINSRCKLLVTIESLEDLPKLKSHINASEEYYIVGEGTNIVMPNYFDGIIIKANFNYIVEDTEKNILKVGAAFNWNNLVKHCVSNGIYGFENLIDIPGSVGASPIQNIGAYGSDVSEVIDSIDCFCLETFQFKTLSNSDCKFTYRDSALKGSKFLIHNINFKINRNSSIFLNYETINKYIGEHSLSSDELSLKDVSEIISTIRSRALPDPNKINNAGSFFKNPIVAIESINFSSYSKDKLILWEQDNKLVKVGAARLIELIKDKISKHPNVSLYDKHCLVLISNGKATQQEILDYASEIKDLVSSTFNIDLEIEPNIVY